MQGTITGGIIIINSRGCFDKNLKKNYFFKNKFEV
jgi:hypothetical protein